MTAMKMKVMCTKPLTYSLVDPGGALPVHAPQQDPFLSYLHMFLLKSVCVKGWHPPNGSAPPQWEILDPPLLLGILGNVQEDQVQAKLGETSEPKKNTDEHDN